MADNWFPSAEFCATRPNFSYETFLDFDEQAERVQNTNARFTQLTAGKFEGRCVSLFLKDITLHIEIDNHYIEAQVVKPTDHFTVCIPLTIAAPFSMFGERHKDDWIDIDPPQGVVDAVIPPNSAYAIIAIKQAALLSNDAMMPETVDWLMGLGSRGALLNSADMTKRLRAIISTTMETAAQIKLKNEMDFLAKSFVLQFAYSLSIAWLRREEYSQFMRTAAFERYYHARAYLMEQLTTGKTTQTDNRILQPLAHLGSKRSIEQAFSQHTTMGPLTYWRVMRLHNARRKLLDPTRRNQAIGDIAAEEGFWEFSRFSMQYRQHFGERPSDTRKQVQ